MSDQTQATHEPEQTTPHGASEPTLPVHGDAAASESASDADTVVAATTDAGAPISESTPDEVESSAEVTESTDAAGSEEAAAEGEAKKKRRRKRKRKAGEGGTESAEGDVRPKRDLPAGPLAHMFTPGAAKRHAFAAGEIVAGRVVRVEDGGIVVDLFGKATAFADEHEPRDVPPIPEPVQEAVEVVAAAEGDDVASASLEESTAETVADHIASAADEIAADEPEVEAAEGTEAAAEGDDESAQDDVKGPLPVAKVVPDEFPRLEPVAVGSVFKGRVASVSESGHIVLVNRNIVKSEVKAIIAQFREERRRVEGLVYGYNRGGFDVLVQGVRAFCPASAMSLQEIKDPGEFLGRKFEFLLPASKGGRDIVVSRRSILERQARKRAKELLRSLQPGQVLDGTVTSAREFGLFVDIGGIEGLVHQSELSHTFGVRPADVAAPGDVVKVKVLRVGGGETSRKTDRKERLTRVSLSMKALQEDPWDSHGDAIAEGVVREGKVTRTTDFGAFIELAPQIEGLLHISELGKDLKHANQAIAEGDSLAVVIERADRKTRRISLSRLSDAELEEYRAGTLTGGADAQQVIRPGARLQVVVDRADHRGVQVRIAGIVGRRSRGFIPASETGTERGSDLRKRFPAGETIEVKVIGNDRDGGLKCSIKGLALDEERKAVKDYRREASKQGFGTFGDLLKAKLGQPGPK